MPHQYSFNQVQIIGDCFNSSDIWTTSFSLGSPDSPSADPSMAGAQAIATAWGEFFTTASAGFTNDYRTLAVKYNKMGTDGRQVTDPTIEYVYGTPVVGGNLGAPQPPQCALVMSLRASTSRGLATKGRMYLPSTGHAIGANGHLVPGAAASVLSGFTAFVADVKSSIDVNGTFILTSPVGIIGVQNLVTEVAVGDVYDTQRRRRNAFQESYTSAAV